MATNRISHIEQNLERWLCLMFYSMIVLTIISEVTRRFVLSYSSIWGEEVARYCFIYLAWIGAALAVKNRVHSYRRTAGILTQPSTNCGLSV